MTKTALVCGAGGFIGYHLVKRLKLENYRVYGADLHMPHFGVTACDEFYIGDLRKQDCADDVMACEPDEIYQLAADMGGAGYIFTGENDLAVMQNNLLINMNVAAAVHKYVHYARCFYASSACVYPANITDCIEELAYPANPDSEYGWEKLYSERLWQAHARDGMDVRIARFHNIFGPYGTFKGGREKAPAALCRKIAEAKDGGEIEIWGTGLQQRSFLYIHECIEGIRRLMSSDVSEPINLGSERIITINGLATLICDIAGKRLRYNNVPGPVGVGARTSNNALIREKLGWAPMENLMNGLRETYAWIAEQQQ